MVDRATGPGWVAELVDEVDPDDTEPEDADSGEEDVADEAPAPEDDAADVRGAILRVDTTAAGVGLEVDATTWGIGLNTATPEPASRTASDPARINQRRGLSPDARDRTPRAAAQSAFHSHRLRMRG